MFRSGPPGRMRRDARATGATGSIREPRAVASSGGARTSRPDATTGVAARPRLDTTQRLFLVAFLGSLAFLAWGVFDRSSGQVAILVAGLLVLSLTLASLAVAGAITAYRAAREGNGGEPSGRPWAAGWWLLPRGGALRPRLCSRCSTRRALHRPVPPRLAPRCVLHLCRAPRASRLAPGCVLRALRPGACFTCAVRPAPRAPRPGACFTCAVRPGAVRPAPRARCVLRALRRHRWPVPGWRDVHCRAGAPSSRGPGRRPFKAEIRGSNPLGATTAAAVVPWLCREGRGSAVRAAALPRAVVLVVATHACHRDRGPVPPFTRELPRRPSRFPAGPPVSTISEQGAGVEPGARIRRAHPAGGRPRSVSRRAGSAGSGGPKPTSQTAVGRADSTPAPGPLRGALDRSLIVELRRSFAILRTRRCQGTAGLPATPRSRIYPCEPAATPRSRIYPCEPAATPRSRTRTRARRPPTGRGIARRDGRAGASCGPGGGTRPARTGMLAGASATIGSRDATPPARQRPHG